MSPTNNLYKAFKRALGGREEPLRDTQWDRLAAELNTGKKRRGGLPFFWVAIVVIGTAAITWLVGSQMGQWGTGNKEKASEVQHPTKGNSDIEKLGGSSNKKSAGNSDNISGSAQEENKNPSNEPINSQRMGDRSTTGSGHIPTQSRVLPDENKSPLPGAEIKVPDPKTPNIPVTPKPVVAANPEGEKKRDDDKGSQKGGDTVKTQNGNDANAADAKQDLAKSNMAKNDKKANSGNGKDSTNKKPRWTFSASLGMAAVTNKYESSVNGKNMHYDMPNVFANQNKNLHARYLNFGLDYMFLPGISLGFKSGVQIRQVYNQVNYSYRLDSIPFFSQDGKELWGYIPGDSASPIVFTLKSQNTVTYMQIPLCLRYPIALGKRNEIVLSGGFNISMIAAAKGKTLSLGRGGIESLSRSYYHPINLGFMGGLQYARQLNGPWWFGFETQWQQNKQSFAERNGKLNSKLQGTNFELIIKYKL